MITQSMIIELRSKTGAGVMNCRNTLTQTNGDMEKAIAILKEKGLAIAAQKAERITAEGLIGLYVSDDHRTGSIIEVNCETDFVAANEDFVAIVNNLARQAARTSASTNLELMAERYDADPAITVQDAVTGLIAKMRENISVRRFQSFQTPAGFVHGYLHHGARVGVLLEFSCKKESPVLASIGKEVAMQIAATNPIFIDRSAVPPEVLDDQRRAFRTNAQKAGKPEALLDKIAAGKIEKYLKEKCLMEQAWIKNEDMTIGDYLREESRKLGQTVGIGRFTRFERAENLDGDTHCQE